MSRLQTLLPFQHGHGSEDLARRPRTVKVTAELTLRSRHVVDQRTGVDRLRFSLGATSPRCDLSTRATQIEKGFRRQGQGQRRIPLTAMLELVPAERGEVELGLIMLREGI
jgi:hypothetical protein